VKHADRLREILADDPVTARALAEARAFALPDWWIVSGAIYNTVWNALTGRPPGHGLKDIDLFYFDADTSYAAEDRVIRRGAAHFNAQPPVEIRNQARVHLWYEDHFGHPRAPYESCRHSIENFASQTHAVGVRLGDDGLEVRAPFGLEAIFDIRMVPNPCNLNRATHEAKAARCKALWPELTIEPWPGNTVIRATPFQDWPGLLALLHRAFAHMEGRIDPPSSLNQLDAASLEAKAKAGTCFLAHDGAAITGCVFCKPIDGVLAISKLAVEPDRQGHGTGRSLMDAADAEARALGLHALELETRIELTENHRAFAAMGFAKIGETTHSGFRLPTSITMRKPL